MKRKDKAKQTLNMAGSAASESKLPSKEIVEQLKN
jgi:hypothetical protein